MSDAVFADTYALICILEGHAGYEKYASSRIATSIFNLAELHQAVLRKHGPRQASDQLREHEHCLTDVSLATVEMASVFRFAHKKERLSYADCIGYALAAQLGIRFLTGDEKFRDKPNVLFVR